MCFHKDCIHHAKTSVRQRKIIFQFDVQMNVPILMSKQNNQGIRIPY